MLKNQITFYQEHNFEKKKKNYIKLNIQWLRRIIFIFYKY